MVATLVFVLLQLPPEVASFNATQVPEHNEVMPVMIAGIGLTVNPAVAVQPLAIV
jgi:hypothetical protein